MNLSYDPVHDAKQLRALVEVLIMSRRSEIVSGYSMRVWTWEKFGLHIDHHEFAYALDALTRSGTVTFHDFHGGDTQYVVRT